MIKNLIKNKKLAQLVDHHSENMGYSDVCLLYSLSSLSHEVSVISSKFKANTIKEITATFTETFTQKVIKNYDYKKVNGYHLYRLNSIKSPFGFMIISLLKKLKPEVIQIGEATVFYFSSIYL